MRLALITLTMCVLLAMTSGSLVYLDHITKRDRLAARVRWIRQDHELELEAISSRGARGVRTLVGIGNLFARSGLLSAKTLSELDRTLRSSGFRGGNTLALFIGSKAALLILLPLSVFFLLQHVSLSTRTHYLVLGVSAVGGLLLPDSWVKRKRNGYLKRLERGLPDALDMLVICTEAGLGLEAAVERVGQEMRESHPEVSRELIITAHELRIAADRKQALNGMSIRTGLQSIKRLGATLIQTMQYGTPLSHALRSLSTEMRQEILLRFEANAARLPVLLTLPMILFIKHTLFNIEVLKSALTLSTLFTH